MPKIRTEQIRTKQQLQALTPEQLSVLTLKDFTSEELEHLTDKQLSELNTGTYNKMIDAYLSMQEFKVTRTLFQTFQDELRQQFDKDLDVDKLDDTDRRLTKSLHRFYLTRKETNKPNAIRQRTYKLRKKRNGEHQYHTFIAEKDAERVDDILFELKVFRVTELNGEVTIHRITRQSELKLLITLSHCLIERQETIVDILNQHGLYNDGNNPFASETQTALALDNLIKLANQAKPKRRRCLFEITKNWIKASFSSLIRLNKRTPP